MKFKINILLILFCVLNAGWSGDLNLAEAASPPCQKAGSSLSDIALRLKPLVNHLDQPLGLIHAGDHSNRLFIVEQKGIVWLVKNEKKMNTPFLDIRKKITAGGEMGLLGLVFHPRFAENHRFYVNYTETLESNKIQSVIAEYRTGNNPDEADTKLEKVLLIVPQPFRNHKGGNLVFGPDGYLYIGFGDGGSGNDPLGNGQNLGTWLGKMLRIDVDHPSPGKAYGIPADNPFVGNKWALPEIWAYGLRNPWRYSFDPLTGLLYAGDVGQNTREEIDIIQKGKNYGWNIMEGTVCTPGVNPQCQKGGLELPILDYGRSEGTVVIGGYVYRGSEIPSLCGAYVYGDFGNGRIWGLRYDGKSITEHHLLLETRSRHRLILEKPRQISSFGEDENHELYVVDYEGEILKLMPR